MKKLLIILFILSCNEINLSAQNIYFQPLQAENFQDDMLCGAKFISDSELIYVTYRYPYIKNQFDINFADVYAHDSILIDISKFNLNTKQVTRLGIKKPPVDSLYYISYDNLYIDSKHNNICVIYYQMYDSLFTQAAIWNIEFFKHKHIDIFDKNLNLKKKIYFPFDGKHILQNRKPIIFNDSFIVQLVLDSSNYANRFFKHNIYTGNIIDSLAIVDTNIMIVQLDYVNDSTFVTEQSNAVNPFNQGIVFYSSNLDSIRKYRYSGLLPGGKIPNGIKNGTFFSNYDSTFTYTGSYTPQGSFDDLTQINRSRCRDSLRFVVNRIDHDSINLVTNYKYINAFFDDYHFIYPTHRFAVSLLFAGIQGLPSGIVLMSLDKDDSLVWKKYIGFDTRYYNQRVIATPDSGCLVLINRYEDVSISSQTDLYYIKFDKNGNQQFNYLTPTKDYDKTVYNLRPIIYPNPSKSEITFKHPDNENVFIEILNSNGQIVYSNSSYYNKAIDIKHLIAGLYVWKITTNRKSFSGLLIKE